MAGPLLRANQRNYSTAGNTYHLNGGHFEVCVNEVLRIGNYLGGPEGRLLASSSGLRGGARTFSVSVPHPLAIAPSLNNYRAFGESQQTGANCSFNVSGCSH